jgi:hypothetical protein
VALVVTALMSLASVALMRAVDTTTVVGGNLSFRQAAMAPSTAAIEDAVAALYENGAIVDRGSDLAARGYYASRQPGEDARGVPRVLQHEPSSTDGVRTLDALAGNTVRYVIERLCVSAGPAASASCNLAVPYVPGATAASEAAAPAEPNTVYRITARVDGPQHAAAYVQMMLRGSSPPRRLSWRILDE